MFLFAWVLKQMLLPVVWLGVAGEKGVLSMRKEWPRSPRPCLGPPVNLLLIAGYNTEEKNVGHGAELSGVSCVGEETGGGLKAPCLVVGVRPSAYMEAEEEGHMLCMAPNSSSAPGTARASEHPVTLHCFNTFT